MRQSTMFDHEGLPLFSGTPERAEADPFRPKPVHRQETFLCRTCGLVACDCDQIVDEGRPARDVLKAVFARWDVGAAGGYKSVQAYIAASRARRALRWYLPGDVVSIRTNHWIGTRVLRFGELLHSGAISASVHKTGDGSEREVNIRKLREVL